MTATCSDPKTEHYSGYTAHGHLWFDVPWMTEIVPGLWQGGVRNGLILPPGIDHLVSLYQGARYHVKHKITTRLDVWMNDALDQSLAQVGHVAAWAHSCWKQGPTLVHCEAGLNRSSLVICHVLMREGMTAEEAVSLVRAKRSPACLCNPAFEEHLRNFRG